MRVLALDPGEKVGYARADVDTATGEWTDFRHGITPLKDMALAVYDALVWHDYTTEMPGEPRYDLVIMEDWRLRPVEAKTLIGSSFPSVQFIGMCKMACWLANVPFVMQGASLKVTADKTMKALRPELYDLVTRPVSHDNGHDLDAIRHLWIHTFKNCNVAPTGAVA